MTKPDETFGDWLRKKRTEKGLSGLALETLSGVSRQYISNLERNLRSAYTNELITPSVEKVDALARGLGVSISEARLAAGYAPKETQSFAEQVNDEEFVALFHKFDNLPTAADKAEIKALLKMVDQQMDLKLKQKKGKPKP